MLENFIDEMRSKYSQEWLKDAQYFYNSGLYSWMEGAVSQYQTILEVGCGCGYSSLALLEKGHTLISVDYKPYCLEQTKQLLENKGYSVLLIKRETIIILDALYEVTYSGIDDNLDSNKVLLIEADILKDNKLVKWLEKKKVDAVVGWLIGGNKSIAKRRYYIQLGIRDDADYRMKIEDSIYCLANKILISGKAINYVSRSMYPTEYDLNEHLWSKRI